ncbi:protein NDR1 [Sesamum alatum]|uniref:Protein NDR1 n=1 Tax=Sesamum alatum TaxID=300844 RepID=A0AAE1Z0Q0_9LAMI|nr:protein NDR1 [Sesamum alatum]
MPEGGGCYRCCSSFIFTSGLTALFMWLSLRTSKPTCSIQDFYVPALNRSDNSTANHTIRFDLKLDNGMKDKGVHYANISLTFFYNSTGLPIANFTVPEFYQGHNKNTRRRALVDASGLPWAEARDAVANGSTVSFRVRLATRVKFKIMVWYTKRHSLVVGGDVVVNDSGQKVNRKGIKLKSGAPDPASQRVRVVPFLIFTFVIILFL